jgi:hypothetical protein
MKLISAFFVLVLASLAGSQTTDPASVKSNAASEQELIVLTRTRAKALAVGDCQGWAKYVDPDFRFIEGAETGNRESVVKECEDGRNAPAGYKQERVLSDFHVQRIGSTAVVDCLYNTIEHFGGVTLTETARQVSTFERRDDSWVVLLAVNTAIFHDPPPSKIDFTTLNALTGRYVWDGAPGMTDVITRKNNKLYVQATRETGSTELIPISSSVFFIHGSAGDRMTFILDATGKVIGEEVRSPDGQGYQAERVN